MRHPDPDPDPDPDFPSRHATYDLPGMHVPLQIELHAKTLCNRKANLEQNVRKQLKPLGDEMMDKVGGGAKEVHGICPVWHELGDSDWHGLGDSDWHGMGDSIWVGMGDSDWHGLGDSYWHKLGDRKCST